MHVSGNFFSSKGQSRAKASFVWGLAANEGEITAPRLGAGALSSSARAIRLLESRASSLFVSSCEGQKMETAGAGACRRRGLGEMGGVVESSRRRKINHGIISGVVGVIRVIRTSKTRSRSSFECAPLRLSQRFHVPTSWGGVEIWICVVVCGRMGAFVRRGVRV